MKRDTDIWSIFLIWQVVIILILFWIILYTRKSHMRRFNAEILSCDAARQRLSRHHFCTLPRNTSAELAVISGTGFGHQNFARHSWAPGVARDEAR